MAEKLEDLNFPNSAMGRLIKEAVSEHVLVGKDARTALGRAASVFVLYVTSAASNVAKKANRKTVTGQDVLDALNDLEFEPFIGPLEEYRESFKEFKKNKKEAGKKEKEDKISLENAALIEENEDLIEVEPDEEDAQN